MKIQKIEMQNYNPSLKGKTREANKLSKYAITSLIASSSLFMLSNAIDTMKTSDSTDKTGIGIIDWAASALTLFGTITGIIGISKNKNSELDDTSNGQN